jgi:hypothetical protein
MGKQYWWLGLLLLGCLLRLGNAQAQSAASIVLGQPQTDAFPDINISMNAYNEDERFLYGLEAGDIQLLEDQQPVKITDFKEIRNGVQLVVVFNPGETFLVRDSQGSNRYELVLTELVEWARNRLGSSIDDLSLLVTTGPEKTHISNPFELFYSLVDYDVENQPELPNLDGLFRGVEIASDTTPRAGMKRAVLFITAPIEGDLSFNIQNLISQAAQNDVRIFVWLVASPDMASSQMAFNMIELVEQTGGDFFTYSAIEEIPNIETYLEPLRNIYDLTYRSQITTGGRHQLQLRIDRDNQQLVSTPIEYEIDLRAPNPVFIAPSLEVLRQPQTSDEKEAEGSGQDGYNPQELEYDILIEFPDGRARAIARSALYVDNVVVDEHVAPPYDRFTWQLDGIVQDGQHILQVQVVDNLGLTGVTIETPVLIKVEHSSNSVLDLLSGRFPLIAGGALALSAALLVLVLILGGKLQPRPFFGLGKKGRKSRKTEDPLTAPVPVVIEASLERSMGASPRVQRQVGTTLTQADAYLIRLSEEHSKVIEEPYPIQDDVLSIGRNPQRATFILEAPSIEELHASIIKKGDGTYWIMDEGSVAGTWVNYAPVSHEGVRLESGDLVHIGKIGLRFSLRNPVRSRKPVIKEEDWFS